MGEVGHLVALVVASIGLAVKLVALWRDPGNPATRAICGILTGFGLAAVVGWDPAYRWIDATTGIPNIAKLLEHSAALIAVASIQYLFLYLGEPNALPRRSRRRMLLLAVVFTVMVGAFIAAPVDVSEPVEFSIRYSALTQIAVYTLAYLTYFAVALADILSMSWRYAKLAANPVIRGSVRLLSVGSVLGSGYVLHKMVFLGVQVAGGDLPWSEPLASQFFITTSIVCLAASLTVPAVVTGGQAVVRWVHYNRLHRQLHPLWLALYRVAPSIVLDVPRWPSVQRVMVLHAYRDVYRRTIEIRDGLRLIGPYLVDGSDPAVGGRPSAYAATIRAAVRSIAAGSAEATPSDHGHQESTLLDEESEQSAQSFDEDVRWLAEVSTALRLPNHG